MSDPEINLSINDDPKLYKLKVIHNLEMDTKKTDFNQQEEHDITIKSCCFVLKKDFTIFIAKLLVSLITMFFCIFMLINNKSCESQSLYSSILCLIIGAYLRM